VSEDGQQFYDLAGVAGLDDGGDGRTSCLLDYDKDGWTDLLVVSSTEPTLQLYRNRLGEKRFPDAQGAKMIAVRVVGGNKTAKPAKGASPREGYGAVLTLDVGEEPILREVRCGDGRAAFNSQTMLIGLGEHERASRLAVRWPSGKRMETSDVEVGSLVTIYEDPTDSPTGESFVVGRYLEDLQAGDDRAIAKSSTQLTLQTSDQEGGSEFRMFVAMFTTCAACAKTQPQVKQLREDFSHEELGIYGVSIHLDEDGQTLAAYAKDHAPGYEVLTDLPLEQRSAFRDFIVKAFQGETAPATVVTDAAGHVLKSFEGVPTYSEIKKVLHH
jgi:hypothetical protein